MSQFGVICTNQQFVPVTANVLALIPVFANVIELNILSGTKLEQESVIVPFDSNEFTLMIELLLATDKLCPVDRWNIVEAYIQKLGMELSLSMAECCNYFGLDDLLDTMCSIFALTLESASISVENVQSWISQISSNSQVSKLSCDS